MFILSFSTLALPTAFSFNTRRKILEVYTPIGISYHQNESNILIPKRYNLFVAGISPYYRGRNVSLPSIGWKGRFMCENA